MEEMRNMTQDLSRKPEREENMVELSVDYMILLKWIL